MSVARSTRCRKAQAQEPAWRYWKARALAAQSRKDDAIRLFGSLATEPHFYGFLAADAIGASIMPVSEPLPVDAEALAAFGARPAVQRVLRLAALDMRPEAQREWVYVVRGIDDDGLLARRRVRAAQRALRSLDQHRRADAATSRFLAALPDAVPRGDRRGGARNRLDEAWVFGLTRQESRFVADIVSTAGAVGLMQLMPSTARWVAQQIDRTDYRIAQLERSRDQRALRHLLSAPRARPARRPAGARDRGV